VVAHVCYTKDFAANEDNMEKFNRYSGAVEENDVQMPVQVLHASSSKLRISELFGTLEDHLNNNTATRYPWAKGFVMGMPLPWFQRPSKWDKDRKVAFITSIWSGVDLGSYLINDVYEIQKVAGVETFREFSESLLDGQQRLTAMEDYILNRIPVPDAAGVPRYWRELSKRERRRFGDVTFVRTTVSSFDEALLIQAYNLRAFGGVAHAESERAVPRTTNP
jgi:hypothetical protein